jgi:hypothetical protein
MRWILVLTLCAGPVAAQWPWASWWLGRSVLLRNAGGQNDQWKAVARVTGSSTCTGVLVETAAEDRWASAPAYLLTNGHCAIFQGANEVNLDQPGRGAAVFNYFVDAQGAQVRVAVKRVAYSTMKGIDLAVLELDSTLNEMAGRGVRPLKLGEAAVGETVRNVGAPVSGIPSGEQFLRLSECRLEAEVELIEHVWRTRRAWRNFCSDVLGGSSGSPLIRASNGDVVGLIFTTTSYSPVWADCALNRPCEWTGAGHTAYEYANYAVPLDGLRSCFEAGGQFNVTRPECPLDPGRQLAARPSPVRVGQPSTESAAVQWRITLSGSLPFYRAKSGWARDVDCSREEGYGPIRNLAEMPEYAVERPVEEGLYAACILAGDTPQPSASWQQPRHATELRLWLDSTPPIFDPSAVVHDDVESWRVNHIFRPPELTRYIGKTGPPDSTECADPAGYRPLLIGFTTLAKRDGPYRYCLIGFDEADNASRPWGLVLR